MSAARLKRLRAYIEEHLDQPLSMGELSAAVQAHPRVLQYSFRRVLGMTPVAYLRVLRLHAVRREAPLTALNAKARHP